MMFVFLAALAVLVLGIGLTWLRVHAQQESKAIAYSGLDLTLYEQMKRNEAKLPYFVDSGGNLHWRNES
jgi:hypothetical protein